MADITNLFGGGAFQPTPKRVDPPDVQLLDAIADYMTPPKSIVLDGKLRRFSPSGKPNDDAGWYVAFMDGVPAGAFGNWRDGVSVPWVADVGRELTLQEKMVNANRMKEAQEKRQKEIDGNREQVADTVGIIWDNGAPASPDHPYLARKGIQPHGAKVTGDGRLMLPLMNAAGELVSLQYINQDGKKTYHTSGETGGMSYQIGAGSGTLYICEGFATGATIQQVTGERVVIAYSAYSLTAVAGALRERHGKSADLVIVADNDESGTGQKMAEAAAIKHGCRIIMPPIVGDVNDYAKAGHDLSALFALPESDWLVQADDWASQPSPIRWLVKGWLQRDGLSMVFGPSGGGKTFVVLDWCLHIASGRQWRGCKTSSGSVVYLAGEGHHGLRARVAAWKQHHKPDGQLNMWLSRSGCDLNTAQGLSQARNAINLLPDRPSLIVVDTLHRFLNGDENSAVDTKTMLDACAELMQEFGCSVLLVHHTGVADDSQHRARGSSAWKGALENQIAIVPGQTIEIAARKMKDSESPESLWCELHQVAIEGWLDEDGEPVKSVVPVEAQAPAAEKKDGALVVHLKTLRNAWAATGYEKDADGLPYLSRSGLIRFLMESMGMSENTAQQSVKPSVQNRLIGFLLLAQILRQNGHGFSVIEPVTAGQMELERKALNVTA